MFTSSSISDQKRGYQIKYRKKRLKTILKRETSIQFQPSILTV